MDEFAMGSSTENSAFHVTKNPHDHSRVPGGSSGGSAAAVAAHFALAALGSDTFGSIRQPSSFCGIVGLKTTYGAVSRSGLIPMTSSMDQIGPMTKTVEDAAILFKAIAGRDPLDSTSSDADYANILDQPLEKIKHLVIGLPEEYFIDGLDPKVANEMQEVIKKLTGLGMKFKKVSLPNTKYAIPSYYLSMPAEVSSNLGRFDGIRYSRIPSVTEESKTLQDIYFKQRGAGFGIEAKRRIILGTFVLSSGYYDAYYDKAQRARRIVKNDFDEVFKEVDVLLTPVAPTAAFKIGEKIDDPLAMYLCDVFTGPANLAGVPAISIPTKSAKEFAPGELPVGFQLIGKKWREADILGIGQYYEKLK
jgi:aspartyl-tRNA(Asn)/glutamyl-tRNA(Gln) amidotransferase subunit A